MRPTPRPSAGWRLFDDLPIPDGFAETAVYPLYPLEAKRDLRLTRVLRRLDRIECLILDDIGYVQHDRSEMEVLFALLAERYERKSVMITSNLVFSKWDQIFKDPMTTTAAIDRLVHHAHILELNVESYRAEEAHERKREQRGKKAKTRKRSNRGRGTKNG